MSSSKFILTIRHLLCYTFIFTSFFHEFSSGFKWIQTPRAKKDAEIGKSVTLRWQYNLTAENETHFQSDLIWKKENKDIFLATRHPDKASFVILGSELYKKFTVNRKNDILFIVPDVQRTMDGSFCLKVQTRVPGNPPKTAIDCSKLFTFAHPLVDFSPKNLTANVTDLVSLYCNATGKPEPDIRWKKADGISTVLASSSVFNLSVTGPSVRGRYMCMANNSFGTDNKTFFVEVQYKPEIQYISSVQTQPEGNMVLLHCNASGNPIPNVTWSKKDTKEDVLIHGQGYATLQLANITRTAKGEYHCTAKNILGETSNKTTLIVHYRPVETTLTATPGHDVILGKELVLNCTSSALPKVNQFKFYRNMSFLENVTDGVLRINNISPSESGTYKCVPSNTLGEGDPASVMINVLEPPVLYEYPNKRITINESDTLELRCKAKGNPLPVITWTKDSTPILQNSTTYKKENASRHDAGVYRCTANNSIGEAKQYETTVTVNYAPIISHIKPYQTVNETNPVSLYCNASGLPTPQVQWFNGSVSISSISTGQASKTLPNVTWNDAGAYRCKAFNILGTKFATSRLIVQYKPINTKITTNTGKNEVVVNETLMLNCSTQAVPAANWFQFSTKNGTLQNSPNSTYAITEKAWIPTEKYTCLPKNILGTGTPSSISISFLEQPSFREVPEDSLTVNETQRIILKCLAKGEPKPNVTWTKDGASDIIGYNEVFIKNNSNSSHAGTYRCRVSNGVGQDIEAEFSVVVNYKPINTQLSSMTGRYGVTINESLTLNCSAQSVPPPRSFTFKINGTAVNRTSSNSTFIVKKTRAFNDENYTCTAKNLLGEGEESNILTITLFERPTIYTGPKDVTVNESEIITLQCVARGKPPPNIVWTKGNSAEVIEYGKTYIKAKADKCDAGVYRCTADNDVKEPVSAQATVEVRSYPGAPTILSLAISLPRIEVHWELPAAKCDLPVIGYLAQVRKKDSQAKWTECQKYFNNSDQWSCNFEELEDATTYTLQIFAKNRFGTGRPAERDFQTKEGGGASGSSDASKGGLSKKNNIIIGVCVGGLFLLIIIVVIVKKLKTKHGESSLQTPIELRVPEEGQPNPYIETQMQNGHDGPMTASQETLAVNETEEKEAGDSGVDNKL